MARKYRRLAFLLDLSLDLPRGFYRVRHRGHDYAIRVGHHLVDCTGEAHDNPMIDHCGVCSPLWGVIPVPLSCGTLDDYRRFRECEHLAVGVRVRARNDGATGTVAEVDIGRCRAMVAWEPLGLTAWTTADNLDAIEAAP